MGVVASGKKKYNDSVYTSERTQCASSYVTTSQGRKYKEKIAIYCENHI